MPNSAPGEGERRAPLPGPGFSAQPLDARLFVVPGLRHRGVRLVRTGGRDAFVFEVDLGRRAELLLKPPRADQRRRPPHPVDVADRLRNVEIALARHLLEDELHWEKRLEIGGADWLLGSRMQDRRQWLGEIGRQVVPSFRNILFIQDEFDLITHATLPFRTTRQNAAKHYPRIPAM